MIKLSCSQAVEEILWDIFERFPEAKTKIGEPIIRHRIYNWHNNTRTKHRTGWIPPDVSHIKGKLISLMISVAHHTRKIFCILPCPRANPRSYHNRVKIDQRRLASALTQKACSYQSQYCQTTDFRCAAFKVKYELSPIKANGSLILY